MYVEYGKYLFLCKFAIIFWSNAPSIPFFFNYALFYEKVQKFGFFSIFISSMISNIPFYIVAFFYVSKYHSILNEFCITFETTFFLPG